MQKATATAANPWKSYRTIALLIALFVIMIEVFLTFGLDMFHLVLAVGGASIYLSMFGIKSKDKTQSVIIEKGANGNNFTGEGNALGDESKAQRRRSHGSNTFQQPDVLQDPKAPVAAPSSQAHDFSTQVEEFLALTSPTAQTDRIVQQVTAHAEKAIKSIFAEVEVAAATTMVRVTAGGVAVPEIDLMASARQERLLEHLQERIWKRGMPNCKIDARKIQRSATRSWTELLVMSQIGFKFRQSHFRSQDSKAALIAPPSFWAGSQGIPVEFSVNHSMSLQNMALLAECKRLEPRAEALILLVRRWAKDRGVCHEFKDVLTPFAWTMLVVYFLQVGVPQGPLLPPLPGTLTSRGDGTGPENVTFSGTTQEWNRATLASTISVGELFKAFVIFYSTEIDFRKEVISIRTGVRAPPSLRMALHIVVHSDQRKEVAPVIEDPFEITRNHGTSMTALGMARLTEELTRSLRLLQIGGSLSELLQQVENCDGDDTGNHDQHTHKGTHRRPDPPQVDKSAGVHADTNPNLPIRPDPPEVKCCPEVPEEKVRSGPVPPQARCSVETPLDASIGVTSRGEPLQGNSCVEPSTHANANVASEAVPSEVRDCGKTPSKSTENAPGSMDSLERVDCVELPANTNREVSSQPDPPEMNHCAEAPADSMKLVGAMKPVGAIKPACFLKPASHPKPIGIVKPAGLIKPAGPFKPAAQHQEHKSAQLGKVLHAERKLSTDDNTPEAAEKLSNLKHAAIDLPVVSDTSKISTEI